MEVKRPLLIIFFVLLVDQVIKIWIKTHLFLGQEYHIAGNWFIIHFTENNGMAFGLEFGGAFGKLILSVFRIALVTGIGWYLWRLIQTKSTAGSIVCFSLIFAGAIGNIIDSAFYGLIFSDSTEGVSSLFPAAGGYAGFLHGRVVDMLYFPLFSGTFPSWIPVWGGEPFQFFRPVFNIADSSISIGVMLLLLFQKKYFPHHHNNEVVEVREAGAGAEMSN
ncbi:MAG: lipoprotein signal peptidase [Bacteroidota bacterium]